MDDIDDAELALLTARVGTFIHNQLPEGAFVKEFNFTVLLSNTKEIEIGVSPLGLIVKRRLVGPPGGH
jgi:hypothetical protein